MPATAANCFFTAQTNSKYNITVCSMEGQILFVHVSLSLPSKAERPLTKNTLSLQVVGTHM